MPPRLPWRVPAQLSSSSFSLFSPSSFLLPSLSNQTQARKASILTSLSDNKNASRKHTRRGRGPSSGKGKTGGRGESGQKKKGNSVPAGFAGGQTPDIVVKGERGFDNMLVFSSHPFLSAYWLFCFVLFFFSEAEE